MWAPQAVVELMRSKLVQSTSSETGAETSKDSGSSSSSNSSSDRSWYGLLSQSFAASTTALAREESEKKLNPFQTLESINAREWIKLILGVVIVAPLRFLLILIVILLGTIAMMATVAGADIHKPLSPWRGFAQQQISAVCGYLICACMGVYHIKVKGKLSSSQDCKMIVVAPHSTVMDAVILAYACRGPSPVGKIEMTKTIVGPFMSALQTIFVDRTDKMARHRVAEEIRTRVSATSPWHRQLLIFPEGTCTNRTSLISFRKGAFEPCAPVQPVVLHWSYTNFDPTWCAGAPSRTLIVLRTLAQGFHTVTVEFLPVYYPNEQERSNSTVYCENVRQLMAHSLGVNTSDHSYEDMFLAQVAAKNKLKPAAVLPFTYASLRSALPKEAKESPRLFERVRSLLLCFAKAPNMSKTRSRLDQAQFEAIAPVAAANLDITKPLKWKDVATDQSGLMSFQDFATAHLLATSSW
mmetsp:Transcript_2168/g.4993  ORF Transcript_2168/g.4993 Transcript_2168/m.4993 type:complete len:468 (-) Transcript_2168:198-1601(-)|eukprot:CAMPEP_0171498780 /NCGR_PEP_ID=MMETSP0958-20121227/8048_1 /TAXON_ID=87120 /ORGANISM="Aurantiochytrium limacinum, Strain ATCCMYA-1381" /LENGTH=467 /DNA_ID=CAMNT_0012033233 /DNA_START=266 /DNA_END=1669 /DNA_ORIENTATION=-